jgi:hypothetical protein
MFDTGGRVVLETPPGNYGTVTHTYQLEANSNLRMVTRADGTTMYMAYNRDGTLAYSMGSATVPTYHYYWIFPDGRRQHQVCVGLSLQSPRYEFTISDWLGRTLDTEYLGNQPV